MKEAAHTTSFYPPCLGDRGEVRRGGMAFDRGRWGNPEEAQRNEKIGKKKLEHARGIQEFVNKTAGTQTSFGTSG